MRVPSSIKINHQPQTSATSRYRHGALLGVHQVELAPLRLSSIQAAPGLGVRSSVPLFLIRLRQPARSYRAASAICLLLPPLLHRQQVFSAETPMDLQTVSSFHPHLLPARATALHFLLRPGLVILQLAVAQATVKAGWPAAFPRLVTEKGSRWAVAAVSFVARSLPGIGRSFPVGLSGSQTWLGTADLAIPFDLFAAADSALAAAASDFAVAAAADLACSVDSACSFAVGMGKGRAVVAISCFLTPRSFF